MCIGFAAVEPIELKCKFSNEDSEVFGKHYQCWVRDQGDLVTNRKNRQITEITGSHLDSKTNADVNIFFIRDSTVKYFPQNLKIFFANLEGILIQKSKLKEIRREDLKIFPELRALELDSNEIIVLEPNLFQFNNKLEWISLYGNQISHVDSQTFDNLIGKLRWFWLHDNTCEFDYAYDNVTKANEIIANIQTGYCKNEEKLAEFLNLEV